MGEVWRALDLELGREVALKMLRELDAGDEQLRRFRREAAIGARIQHPGITVVHDIGQHENQLFIVMELLQGEDLARVLAREPGGLPLPQAVDVAAQTARALSAMHAQGVVHRDLKPANLFLLTDGRLKICDFGIARGIQAVTTTGTGWMLGSPPYMAPEQWRGKQIDTRADLYALGCVFYELLTGAPPFRPEGEPLALMHRHFEEAPAPLREIRTDIPEELEILVAALLSKNPDARPDAASTADRLQAIQELTPASQASATRATPLSRSEEPPASTVTAATPPQGASPGAPTTARKFRRRTLILGGTAALAAASGASLLADRVLSSGVRTRSPIHGGTLGSVLTTPPQIKAIAISPDSNSLASGGSDVRLWDLATGSTTAAFNVGALDMFSVAFSPDGKTLAAGGDSTADSPDERAKTPGTIVLWNVAARATITALDGHTPVEDMAVFSVAFSPDGKILANSYFDYTIRLWDLSSRRMIATLIGHTNPVLSLAFSPDGATLASSSTDTSVRLWDLATRKLRATLAGHTWTVGSVAFSPDGRTLASGSIDETIRLWDVATASASAVLPHHDTRSVAFSPDGTALASGGGDKAVRLWDLATHEIIATLTGHTAPVIQVAFSPDGKTLVSAGDDRTIRLWHLTYR
jgi:serine/threonine protein kinase